MYYTLAHGDVGVFVCLMPIQTHWIFYWINIYTGYFVLCQHNFLFVWLLFCVFCFTRSLKLKCANTWYPSHISVNRMEILVLVKFTHTHMHTRCLSQWTRMLAKKRECAKKKTWSVDQKSINHKIWAGYFFFLPVLPFRNFCFFFYSVLKFWFSKNSSYNLWESR